MRECACPGHVDDQVRAAIVPFATELGEQTTEWDTVTVGDLIEWEALAVEALDPDGQDGDMPHGYQHEAWVGDEARSHYDDEGATLGLDRALALQPGVEDVYWQDREVLLVNAPTMCPDGLLATLAAALLDSRVRAVWA